MPKYTDFFLSVLTKQITEDDLYNLNSMPCEVGHFVSSPDNLIRMRLATTGKKYIFFGPVVYRRTDMADALISHIFGY